MNSTFKKVALASALLASSALATPAFAAITAAAGGDNDAVAPYTTKFAVANGKKVLIKIGLTGAQQDNWKLFAVLYKSDDSVLDIVQVGAEDTVNTATALTFNGTLPSTTAYAKVAFVLVKSGGANGDTFGGSKTGVAASTGTPKVIPLQFTDHNTIVLQNDVTSAALSGNTSAAAALEALSAADKTLIGNAVKTADINNLIATTPDYVFGVSTVGRTDNGAGTATSSVKIKFNAMVAKNVTGTEPAPQDLAVAAVNNALRIQKGTTTSAAQVKAAVTANTASVVEFEKSGGGAFGDTVDNLDILDVLTASNAEITDVAGNLLNDGVAKSDIAINVFADPALASTGTAKVILSGLANAGNVSNLYDNGANGGFRNAQGNLTFSIRMSEAITNFDAGEDLKLPTGLTYQNPVGGNGTATVTALVSVDNNYALRIANTGELYLQDGAGAPVSAAFDPANPGTATKVVLGIAKKAAQANVVKTLLGDKEVGTADLTGTAYVGVAATPAFSTSDADASGTLDGVKVTFGAPLNTTLPSNTGTVLFKKNGSATTSTDVVASAATILANSSNKIVQVKSNNGDKGITDLVTTASETEGRTNTGATSATTLAIPFDFALTKSEITYSNVYAATGDRAGSLAQVRDIHADVTSGATITDGAKPVVKEVTYVAEQGTSPAAGQLKIVASETLQTTGGANTFDAAQILAGGAPLTLQNLNDNVTALSKDLNDVVFSKTNVTNDTLLIGKTGAGNGKVTASVLNKQLTLSTTTSSGLRDTVSADNFLATAGKTITAGGTTYSGPKIVQAIGTRSTNAVDGNIDTVLVKFDKAVSLKAGGTLVDGMFKVKANVNVNGTGTDFDVSVPGSKVTVGTDGYVTLELPTPGIVGTTKLNSLKVEYDTNGSNEVGSTHASLNRLVSTDATAAEINENGTFGTGDDGADVTFSKNTTKLYTMEVTGKLTTDGSAAAAKGTIIRADLVELDPALTYKSGSMTVPCSCAAGSTTLALTSATDITNELDNAVKLGKSSITAFAEVALNATTGSAVGVKLVKNDNALNVGTDGKLKYYPVTISKTGQVTGTAGATGSLVLETVPALKVRDTVYQVTNDGNFRFAVGMDQAPTENFVMVSAKQPGDKFFTGLTSAVPSFANYLPFASNVVSSGVIGGNLGTVNLAKIGSSSVATGQGWQLVGFQGEIARNSVAALKAKPVEASRLLITNRSIDGAPATAWSYENTTADDEAFLLLNNVTSSALQIGTASVDGLKDIDGGFALALKNKAAANKDYSYVDAGATTVNTDAAIVEGTEPFTVFYPLANATSKNFGATAGKWSLLTIDTGVASLSDWAATNKVAAIIVVGSGNAQKSWFKGSTTNTLTALSKGDRAFIYFEGANTAFKFGR